MKKTYKLLLVGISVIFFSACIKDQGNYDYKYGNEVTIRFSPSGTIQALIGEPVTVEAVRTYADPDAGLTAADYDHEWYVAGELYSTDSTLVFTGTTVGNFPLRYHMIDRESGVRMFGTNSSLNVTSPYQNGWSILYEQGGKSEIAHIRVTNGEYFDYTGLYGKANNGEELGSEPYRIKDYPVPGGRATAIIQQGGQGSVKLDGLTMEKRLVTKDAFVGGPPAGLAPINMASYATSAILLNEDGKVYPRFWTGNPIAFTVPWLGIPMQVEKGMKIREIWDTWSGATTYAFMYDELNNRILYIRLDAPNTTGGVAAIDTLPSPIASAPYPPDHVNPNDMGDWVYVWGGTFNDAMYNGTGAILMKEPNSSKMFLQTFGFQMVNRVPNLSAQQRWEFTGSHLVNANSKYVAIKSRNYLFFSGGPNNSEVYYFDLVTGGTSKLYASVGSSVTTLRQSDNSLELAVGLENGTVIIYDISQPILNAGNSEELHRLSGLGRVVDIYSKAVAPSSGQMR